MKTYKIAIPEPCSEDWNKMTQDETGRFCQHCSKSVIDFSVMSDTEIKNYLEARKNESVCGRFTTRQLDRVTIQVPSQVLFSQTQFRKIFLLALLFSMGTTLLSCSDDFGNKQKIENVVITDSVATENELTNTDTLPPSFNTQEKYYAVGMVSYIPDSTACKSGPVPPPPPEPSKPFKLNPQDVRIK